MKPVPISFSLFKIYFQLDLSPCLPVLSGPSFCPKTPIPSTPWPELSGLTLSSHRSTCKAQSPQPSVSNKTLACSLAPKQTAFKVTDLLHQTNFQWAWWEALLRMTKGPDLGGGKVDAQIQELICNSSILSYLTRTAISVLSARTAQLKWPHCSPAHPASAPSL